MAERTVIIMSDSHGDREIVSAIKERYLGKVDAILHNGDSELSVDDPIWQGISVVTGNCDSGSYPEKQVLELSPFTIAQVHGHLFAINFTFSLLKRWANEVGADVCTYGHLHRPAVWQEGKTVFINPGSVSEPRGEIDKPLYAKVVLTDDKILVDYFTRDHKLYKELSQEVVR